jgi:plasmid stabilization system protein ParE
MTWCVIIQPRALRDLDEAYQYLSSHYSVETAATWYTGFLETLYSLDENPLRFGFARENGSFDIEIREVLYRRHRSVHRALYTVQGDAVRILCVRHSAQNDVMPDDVSDVR